MNNRFNTERAARRWAKNNKFKVKCVEYLKSGCRLQVIRDEDNQLLTLRVDDLSNN
jgi:arsenate reductase-like glutaredoxin family protein